MFCLLSDGAHKTFLAGHRFSQFAALTTILCAGLFFSSCGSAPGNSSAATASNSAAGLSVTATLPTATVGAAYSGELTRKVLRSIALRGLSQELPLPAAFLVSACWCQIPRDFPSDSLYR
jgi:hypothetical protein